MIYIIFTLSLIILFEKFAFSNVFTYFCHFIIFIFKTFSCITFEHWQYIIFYNLCSEFRWYLIRINIWLIFQILDISYVFQYSYLILPLVLEPILIDWRCSFLTVIPCLRTIKRDKSFWLKSIILCNISKISFEIHSFFILKCL